ncbi:GLPGLI family protein [Chryseobacterium oranimense]|uniref:GLPGLI family protein n=1 Tax=Chryseobacterium oranimense TaxID=421058 RepID=UPI0021AF9C2E|nr:GLPGLI family protein [Chryseobacterium oranimense]UWX61559.1 GLPGLI family protein [Chryseobacterium oranimense]
MKKKLVCAFINLFSVILSAQEKAVMEINYETKMIPDSLAKEKINIFQSVLLLNNNQSAYFSREAKAFFNNDVKVPSSTSITTNMGIVPRYPKSVASILNIGGKQTAFLPVGKYIFSFEEPNLKWETLSQTKNIKGYKCRIAKTITDTGDEFFAWYTEDIAIPDGPFRFKGLSGLVLEVYNKNRTIEIYATDIKKSEEFIEPITYDNLVNAKSKMQFIEARKNYAENPSMYNGNLKILDSNGNDKTKGISERLKKINVFLD